MDFLFHTLSEKEKEEVREEARRILESFSEKISEVKVPEKETLVERRDFERDESAGKNCDENFRKMIFENAPDKNNDFIIAERKRWE